MLAFQKHFCNNDLQRIVGVDNLVINVDRRKEGFFMNDFDIDYIIIKIKKSSPRTEKNSK